MGFGHIKVLVVGLSFGELWENLQQLERCGKVFKEQNSSTIFWERLILVGRRQERSLRWCLRLSLSKVTMPGSSLL